MRKQQVKTGLFAGLNSWDEARDKAAQRGNRALREVIELIEEHKLRGIRACVDSARNTGPDANLTLSTVHQAKGLESERVGLLDDFHPDAEFLLRFRGKDIFAPGPKALRHLYVALTRAKHELNVPMSLARRFGIDSQLTNRATRIEAPPIETEAFLTDVSPAHTRSGPTHASYIRPAMPLSHTTVMPSAVEQYRPDRNSFWYRWGARLLIAIGVLANLLLADYKGLIELSVLATKIGL